MKSNFSQRIFLSRVTILVLLLCNGIAGNAKPINFLAGDTLRFRCKSADSLFDKKIFFNRTVNKGFHIVIFDFFIPNSEKDTLIIKESKAYKLNSNISGKQPLVFDLKNQEHEKEIFLASGLGAYVLEKSKYKLKKSSVVKYKLSPLIYDRPFVSTVVFSSKFDILQFELNGKKNCFCELSSPR